MEHEATSLMFDGGRVTGVRYRTRGGSEEASTEGAIHADLVVATDGRHSVLRRSAGLQPKEYPVPFDTWWFKLPRHASEKGAVAGIVPAFRGREAMIALFRDDYYQMGYLGPKGTDARIRAEGVERFRERVAALRPDLADRVDAIRSLDDLHFLDVRLDRLRRWYVDGLLCIGDAAHAMSPAGGVGINLAIQDAVAAAARLAPGLLQGRVTVHDLAAVERRRRMPTVLLQTVQRIMHRAVFVPLFAGRRAGVPSVVLFLARRVPALTRLMPRLIAFGPRPEHAPGFARRAQRSAA
jgi:2-polyprenyl-6-methoxyphenol hydroxylase-like FAD-dependent oxidoreductase